MAAAASTGVYFLAGTGQSSLTIQTPPGLSAGGSVVAVNGMASSFTRPQGNANIQAGVAIEQLLVAESFANRVKVDVSWLNPQDAGQVLNNPNAQIYIGVYHPIYTGTCVSGVDDTIDDTRATIVDSTLSPTTYCAALDTAATGTIVNDGKMVISRSTLGGFLNLAATASSPVACTSTTTNTAWCLPSSGTTASQLVAWVGATIVTPGGKPAGQQNNVDSLNFFVQAKSH